MAGGSGARCVGEDSVCLCGYGNVGDVLDAVVKAYLAVEGSVSGAVCSGGCGWSGWAHVSECGWAGVS